MKKTAILLSVFLLGWGIRSASAQPVDALRITEIAAHSGDGLVDGRLRCGGVIGVGQDPDGVAVAVAAMTVVLAVLVLLYLLFKVLGATAAHTSDTEDEAKAVQPQAARAAKTAKGAASGEVYAAIAFAMHRYQTDLSTEESHVVTINKVARTYSPWSSKIYGLRQIPDKKR